MAPLPGRGPALPLAVLSGILLVASSTWADTTLGPELADDSGGLAFSTKSSDQNSTFDLLSMSGEWRLIAIDSNQLRGGSAPTVVFGDEGDCWGSTGINDFHATFDPQRVKFRRLQVGNASVKRNMGPPEAMAVEKLFLSRLETAISYEVRGDLLYLDAGEDHNLTFERVVQ